jgi:DNA-binding MarR family transcriptional regulator
MARQLGGARSSPLTIRRALIRGPVGGGQEALSVPQQCGEWGAERSPLLRATVTPRREQAPRLFHELTSLGSLWRRRLANLLEAEFAISLPYFYVVSALERLGCCTPEEAASDAPCSLDAALVCLAQAEQRRDSRHVRHMAPGARSHVRLTSQGYELAARADHAVARELEALFGVLSAERLQMLSTTLRRIGSAQMRVIP